MRKALVVGINDYKGSSLTGCVNDAIEVTKLLERHSNGNKNFDIDCEHNLTKGELLSKIKALFRGGNNIELFYFSGHGFWTI